MIVTCQNCDTSFQLDDSRVPEQGIRVRCSRCKEAFFLQHPSASRSEAVNAVASEAARKGKPTPPDTTQDLPSSGQIGGAAGGDEDEHDWEFSVDPSQARGGDEDDSVADFRGTSRDEASGLELEGEEDDIAASTSDDEAADESDFGSVDDFSSLMEEDVSASSSDLEGSDRGLLSQPESDTSNLAGAGQHAAQNRADDLGEPENWDFFGEEDSGVSTDGTPLQRGGNRPGLPTSAGFGDVAGGIGDLTRAWGSEIDDDYEAGSSPGAVSRGLRIAGQAAGWMITLSLAALGLSTVFWSTAESMTASPQSIQVGPLQADEVFGHWVDTSRGETLLVVSGELSPRGEKPATASGIIEVTLLGPEGRALEVDAQPAGLPIGEVELREAGADELRIAQDRAAWALAGLRIQQGIATPFQAIFRDVPPQASRVGMRILLDSAPPPDAMDDEATGMLADPALVPVDGTSIPEALRPAFGGGTTPAPVGRPGTSPEPSAGNPLPDELTWGE